MFDIKRWNLQQIVYGSAHLSSSTSRRSNSIFSSKQFGDGYPRLMRSLDFKEELIDMHQQS